MTTYKELFLKSQAIIASTIENLEIIADELKNVCRNVRMKLYLRKIKLLILMTKNLVEMYLRNALSIF